jgi:DNA polymerase II small subunit/DNA polymerase delta subunit B
MQKKQLRHWKEKLINQKLNRIEGVNRLITKHRDLNDATLLINPYI